MNRPSPDSISIVIPVYNGAESIEQVVDRVTATFRDMHLQIVLVNDGSSDDSEAVCQRLVDRMSGQVPVPSQLTAPSSDDTRSNNRTEIITEIVFVQLARNYGEHNAVLCGLHHATGDYVAVMDDDAQNPPEEIPAMLEHLRSGNFDVVYGRYAERKHTAWRRLGSYFNDRMATIMLRKPSDLYLSSFKLMNRFLVSQIIKYEGPFPYIDGLVFRATTRIGQIEVKHDHRASGTSGYTLTKLVGLWLNMFLGFSILPLRLSVFLGLFTSALSVLGLLAIVIDKIWVAPNVTVGIPTVLVCIMLFSGVQLTVLGTVGEYVGRIFQHTAGRPTYVERYATNRASASEECQ